MNLRRTNTALAMAALCAGPLALAARAAEPPSREEGAAPAGEAAPAEEPEPVYDTGMPQLQFYGFLRLDMNIDDSQLSHPQYAMWAKSEGEGGDAPKDDSGVTIHPRLTRLGFKILPWRPAADVTISGKFEVDFQAGGSESRALMRLRQAWGAVSWQWIEFLAGQHWEIISPLLPNAHLDGIMWNTGNLGDRRPQMRLTLTPTFGAATVRIATAVGMTGAVDNKNMDEKKAGDTAGDVAGLFGMDGYDIAQPNVQGLVEVSVPIWTKKPLIVGFSGSWAEEATKFAVGTEKRFVQAMVSAHLRVPILERLWLSGEVFYGQNLSDLRGGIGQGVNTTTGQEIVSMGGWLELSGQPMDWLKLHGGFAIDDPDDADLPAGGRAQNWAFWAVAQFRPWTPFQVAVEYMHWQTKYLGKPGGDANRWIFHASWFF